MSDTLINVERLEAILQKHWAEFIEPTQMMRLVLEHTRDTKFLKVEQEQIPKKNTQIVGRVHGAQGGFRYRGHRVVDSHTRGLYGDK